MTMRSLSRTLALLLVLLDINTIVAKYNWGCPGEYPCWLDLDQTIVTEDPSTYALRASCSLPQSQSGWPEFGVWI